MTGKNPLMQCNEKSSQYFARPRGPGAPNRNVVLSFWAEF